MQERGDHGFTDTFLVNGLFRLLPLLDLNSLKGHLLFPL